MSPEQARGQKVDSRTDLFALGVVLYEMATGRQAFTGTSTAVLYDAILNRNPVSIREIKPSLPPELETIVGKAIEKERGLRYQHASELRTDLMRLKRSSDSGRLAAAPIPTAKRTRLAIALVGMLAVVLTVGLYEVAPVCGQLGGLFKVYSGCRSSCQNLLGSIFLSPLLRRWVSGQGA